MAASYNELFGLGGHSEDSALEGWWKLQDNAGSSSIVDSSSNGITATLNGSNTSAVAVAGPTSWLTSALDLAGPNGWISYGPANWLDSLTGATFLIRVNVDSLVSSAALFSDWVATADGHILFRMATTGRLSLFVNNTSQNGSELVTSTLLSPSSGWQTVSARFNSGTRIVGIDGTYASGAGGGTALTATNSANLQTGESPHASASNLDGQVADAVIFSRSLSDAEIAEWVVGPEPLNTVAPTLSFGASTWTGTIGTWDSQSNGTIVYTWQLRRASDNGVEQSGTGSSPSGSNPAAGSYYLWVRGTNDGGFDAAEDSVSTTEVLGGSTPSGSGAVSAVGTIAGTGQAVKSGSGDVSTTAAISGFGQSTRAGSGGIDAIASAAGAGQSVRSGSGLMQMFGVIVGVGQSLRSGLGSVETAGVIIGVGVAPIIGSASGFGVVNAAGELSGVGNVPGAGTGSSAIYYYLMV